MFACYKKRSAQCGVLEAITRFFFLPAVVGAMVVVLATAEIQMQRQAVCNI